MSSIQRWCFSQQLPHTLIQQEDARHRPLPNPDYLRCAAALKEKLAAAMPNSVGRCCLIAGAGPCHDVPVGLLAKRFAEVRLVDVREFPMMGVHEDHVSRWQEDVTGMMAGHLQSLEKMAIHSNPIRRATTLSMALDQLGCEEVSPSWAACSECDFVASTLLLSQLGRPVQTMMLKILDGVGLPAVEMAYTAYLQRVQQQHIRWLSQRTLPGGKVFLSMTPRLLVRRGRDSTMIPLVSPRIVDAINAHFDVEERTTVDGWVSGERSFEVEAWNLLKR